MAKLGADLQVAPPVDVVRAFVLAGVRWLCAYIGGPTALGIGWTRDYLASLAGTLPDGFLPTYAGVGWGGPFTVEHGQAHGQEAAQLAQQSGFSGGPLALDLEARAYDAGRGSGIEAYAQAWADTVRAAGYQAVLYGTKAACDALGARFDHVWLASWVASGQGAEQAPPARLQGYWQYASGVPLGGMIVDLSTAADDAPLAWPDGVLPEPAAALAYDQVRVTHGDTLSGLAERYGHSGEWPALWEANRDALPDPNHLQVGQVLTLPDGWVSEPEPEPAWAPDAAAVAALDLAGENVLADPAIPSADLLKQLHAGGWELVRA